MQAEAVNRELDRLEADETPFEILLTRTIELLHGSDERFHWTGLYELFHDNILRLGPYVGGNSGPETLGVGRSLRGAAIAGRRSIVVSDILRLGGLEAGFGPGARLMVPVRSEDEVFGEIEIESFTPEAFDEACLRGVEQIADRLAALFTRERELVLFGV